MVFRVVCVAPIKSHMVELGHDRAPGFYRRAVETSTVAFVVVGDDAVVSYQTPAAARMLRGPEANLVGELFPALFTANVRDGVDAYLRMLASKAGEGSAFIEVTCTLADADERWIEITGANLLGVPEVDGIVLNLSDRTEHHRALEHVINTSLADPLTGVGNRRALEARLATLGEATVIMTDLDAFKGVNDRFGHRVGDLVLGSVARRLRDVFGVSGSVYRLGGDEFVTVLPDMPAGEALSLAELALAVIRTPIGEDAIHVSASMGVAHSIAGEGSDALRRADRALYRAKGTGRGAIALFDEQEEDWETRRRSENAALDASLQRERKLKAEVVRLAEESRTDKRTALLSAEAFEADIVGIDTLARQRGRRYAIALCDIDYFGRYNNDYLYANGNIVLRKVADAMKAASRPRDLVYRYGGEELVVVLPDTQLRDAAALGERLRTAVETLGIPQDNRPPPHHVTISVGVAALDVHHHGRHEDVLEAANRCLRVAKRGGRNRVDPLPREART
jgi:diguanylate cyclase (GGDEF)-like protein